jgi:hypothetical protein
MLESKRAAGDSERPAVHAGLAASVPSPAPLQVVILERASRLGLTVHWHPAPARVTTASDGQAPVKLPRCVT